jgi:hypothetical protein
MPSELLLLCHCPASVPLRWQLVRAPPARELSVARTRSTGAGCATGSTAASPGGRGGVLHRGRAGKRRARPGPFRLITREHGQPEFNEAQAPGHRVTSPDSASPAVLPH